MIKPCKLCEKKRYVNTSWCWVHYREREKLKKEEKNKKALLRKLNSKGYQENLRKLLHNKAWKLMSEVVRREGTNLDGFGECYTCGKMINWKEANAGHWKHDRLDFDFRNLKRQCVTCNKYHSGRLDVYTTKLIEENGLVWLKKLEQDAWEFKKYSIEELKQIIEDLKERLKILCQNEQPPTS